MWSLIVLEWKLSRLGNQVAMAFSNYIIIDLTILTTKSKINCLREDWVFIWSSEKLVISLKHEPKKWPNTKYIHFLIPTFFRWFNLFCMHNKHICMVDLLHVIYLFIYFFSEKKQTLLDIRNSNKLDSKRRLKSTTLETNF